MGDALACSGLWGEFFQFTHRKATVAQLLARLKTASEQKHIAVKTLRRYIAQAEFLPIASARNHHGRFERNQCRAAEADSQRWRWPVMPPLRRRGGLQRLPPGETVRPFTVIVPVNAPGSIAAATCAAAPKRLSAAHDYSPTSRDVLSTRRRGRGLPRRGSPGRNVREVSTGLHPPAAW